MNVLMKNTWRGTPYAIAGAIYFGITAMYLPWPTGDSTAPSSPDMGIPSDEQPQPRKSCKAHSDCPSPQACVDGVCCLPAVKQRDGRDNYQVRPYPGPTYEGPTNQPFPSRLYSAPHGLAMLGWYDSLRISK